MTYSTEEIDKIQQLSRETEIVVTEYGKYTSRDRKAIYVDAKKEYSVPTSDKSITKVNNVFALIDFIAEEFNRRSNKDGNLSTLQITNEGGRFKADDDFNEGLCGYNRVLSQQWEFLSSLNGKILYHDEFLMSLLKLSPSISNFKAVYRDFLTVRRIGNEKLISNPVFVNNESETGYLVKYSLDGGTVEAIIPEGFLCQLPYSRYGKDMYDLQVDAQFLNNGSDRLQIKINIPTIDSVEEEAILDEVNHLKDSLKKFGKMLVLSDI